MEKKDIKIGMTVDIGRHAKVTKIQGNRAKVCPWGESGRWMAISDLTNINKDNQIDHHIKEV